MKKIDTTQLAQQKQYHHRFSVTPLVESVKNNSIQAVKPIVNINYINAEELEAKSFSGDMKQSHQTPENYLVNRTKKNKKPSPLFSLPNIGIALTTIGTLDFLTSKHYLSGSLLFGGGLLAYGIGKNLENIK